MRLRRENGIRHALQAGPVGSAQVVNRADEIGASEKIIGCKETKNDCADPGSDEAFDSLLRAELDQLSTTEGDATDIGKDIIATSFKRSISHSRFRNADQARKEDNRTCSGRGHSVSTKDGSLHHRSNHTSYLHDESGRLFEKLAYRHAANGRKRWAML